MALKPDEQQHKVVSKAFALWKARETDEHKRISMDSIIEDVGLSKTTVRRFLEPNGDVSSSSLSSAAVFAEYFGVQIGDIVERVPTPASE